MFALSHGMEHHEWLALPEDERNELLSKMPLDEPVHKNSDAETLDDASSTQASAWEGWSSGESQRDAAKSAKHWPDGAPIGRGHGQPYLQAHWARQLRNGLKQVEGRPDEGVRLPRAARHACAADTCPLCARSGQVMSAWMTTSPSRSAALLDECCVCTYGGSGAQYLCTRVKQLLIQEPNVYFLSSSQFRIFKVSCIDSSIFTFLSKVHIFSKLA